LYAGTAAIGWKYLLVYCCWIAVEAILIFLLWPETSGRSLEELAFCKSLTDFGYDAARTWSHTNTYICAVFEDEDLARRTTQAVEKEIQHESHIVQHKENLA